MKNIIILSLLTLLFACSKKKIEKTTSPKLGKETVVVKQDSVSEAKNTPKNAPKAAIPEGIDANLIAQIKRTPCYGKCRAFTIELYNNGVVKYKGTAYVERKGAFVAKVSLDFIKKIQDKALAIKYLSLENKYPIAAVAIPDLPVTTTFIRIGNVGKQITDNFDAPRELIEFEIWLEQEFEKLDWKAE